MDEILFLLSLISTIATVVSTVIAVRARNEARNILQQIKEVSSRNIDSTGRIDLKNTGSNSGIITAINSGDIHND